FNDPHTASNQVRQQITAQLGPQEYDVVALYSSPGRTVDDPAFRQAVLDALWPLLIGVVAIFGAFIVTRLLTYVTDVSVFAINIITLIGLGLSIDYALFIVSRFREELAAGYDKRTAVARTTTTAGRTVAVSGLTVTLALASLLLFPQPFLKSMA